MNQYSYDYFIKRFEAIPEDKWCVGEFTTGDGVCCVQGHLLKNPIIGGFGINGLILRKSEVLRPQGTDGWYHPTNHEFNALFEMFESHGIHPATVNNSEAGNSFPGNTPKERILNALYFFKEQCETECLQQVRNQLTTLNQ